MHEVLVNRLGGLSLPRKSVVRLTDRRDMTLDVYRGRKTTMQQSNNLQISKTYDFLKNNRRLSIKNTRSAEFCADRIDVITNFAVITNVVIKRVHCITLTYFAAFATPYRGLYLPRKSFLTEAHKIIVLKLLLLLCCFTSTVNV